MIWGKRGSPPNSQFDYALRLRSSLEQASVSLGAPRMPTNTQHSVASTAIFQASQTHADPIPSHLKSTFTQLKKGFGPGAETQSLF